MHLEFNVNDAGNVPRERNGNSGVYLQQRYELQILNSFGVPESDFRKDDCGCIYRTRKPDFLVSRPAGQWQSFDIAFRAARFNGETKTQPARLTVYHNGVLVHDDVELNRKTGAGKSEDASPRPIKLQGHHNQVQFRNVWVQPLQLGPPSVTNPEPSWLKFTGKAGPGQGKHVVLIAADQEYRSEQALPMLAKVLAERHGFDCTVLFSVNDEGLVDPTLPAPFDKDGPPRHHRIPGLEQLESADCLIWLSRFMQLPDDQLKLFHQYFDSGKPIIALRTANHGFWGGTKYVLDGKQVSLRELLGGSFMGHHGGWHRESTRGVIVEEQQAHPILTGVSDIWGPSDVYRCHNEKSPLPEDCTTLVMGQPLVNLEPNAKPNSKKEALPIAWTKTWTGNQGLATPIFHFTMGSGRDFENEGVRRLVVNSVYWGAGLEDQIDGKSSVDPVGEYQPLKSGFNYDALGVQPRPVSSFR